MAKRVDVRSAVLAAAFVATACGSAGSSGILTVQEVIPRIDELNGMRVSVSGYLAECGGYDCMLWRNKQDADEWGRFMAAMRANRRIPMPDHPTLGIGTGGRNFEFDAMAAPYRNSYVVITGIVTNQCRYQGKPDCTDRSPDLNPTAIRAGNPPPE